MQVFIPIGPIKNNGRTQAKTTAFREEAISWLEQNIQREWYDHSFSMIDDQIGLYFEFEHEEDAILFKMRFG